MQVIRSRLSRSKNTGRALRWALALSALAATFPAMAAAQVQPRHPHVATARANAGLSRDNGLDHVELSFGSGYDTPGGSALVRAVQRRLVRAGDAPNGVDGVFGPRTRQAVIAFQAAHGLQQDGVVGPQTWAALAAKTLSLGPGAADEPGGSGEVRRLQRHLAADGGRPGPIDGHFGPTTAAAVERFQRSHGLRVDGIAGPSTLALMASLAKPADKSTARPAPQSTSRPAHKTTPRPAHRSTAAPSASQSNAGRVAADGPATPTRTAPAQSAHPTGSVPWDILVGLALVLACVLAFIVGAVWYLSRRGDGQFSPAPAAGGDTDAAEPDRTELAPADVNAAALAAPGSGAVGPTVATAGTVATNGDGARANGDGVAPDGNGAHPDVEPPELRQTTDAGDAGDAFALGMMLEAHGTIVQAQAAYTRADEGGHATAAANLGRLHEKRGALAEAEAAYRRADERGDAEGAFNLGMLLEGRSSTDEAADAYRRATERGHDGAACCLGAMLVEQGKLGEADAAFRRADDRGDAAGAFNLGVLLEDQGCLTSALDAYLRAEQRGDGDVANMARTALLELRERREGAGAHNG
jgi:peptidoglycan hydrolase-like protein with peptidoglycan-binding domain